MDETMLVSAWQRSFLLAMDGVVRNMGNKINESCLCASTGTSH